MLTVQVWKMQEGIPVLLPVLKDPKDSDPLLAMCDGLLIPGGVDVDPRFYNEDPSALLGSIDSAMDLFPGSTLQNTL